MEFKVSLEQVTITAAESAPPLTDWLATEAARWISHTQGQEVVIAMAKPKLITTDERR